jgi:DNA-binding LytR/AlgR family response regulator
MLKKMLISLLGDEIKTIKVQRSLLGSQCYIWEHQIDLLFLDLDLMGEDGFDLLKQAVAGAFHTIIVSAHVNRAIEAFEYGVLDFIPKPYDEERLRKALERYRDGQSGSRLKYISVAREGKISLIPMERVAFFEADDKTVKIHLEDGATESYSKTLQNLSKILTDEYFRIHRSFIIRLSDVNELRTSPNRRYSIELKNKKVLPVSRNIYPELKERIQQFAES